MSNLVDRIAMGTRDRLPEHRDRFLQNRHLQCCRRRHHGWRRPDGHRTLARPPGRCVTHFSLTRPDWQNLHDHNRTTRSGPSCGWHLICTTSRHGASESPWNGGWNLVGANPVIACPISGRCRAGAAAGTRRHPDVGIEPFRARRKGGPKAASQAYRSALNDTVTYICTSTGSQFR